MTMSSPFSKLNSESVTWHYLIHSWGFPVLCNALLPGSEETGLGVGGKFCGWKCMLRNPIVCLQQQIGLKAVGAKEHSYIMARLSCNTKCQNHLWRQGTPTIGSQCGEVVWKRWLLCSHPSPYMTPWFANAPRCCKQIWSTKQKRVTH